MRTAVVLLAPTLPCLGWFTEAAVQGSLVDAACAARLLHSEVSQRECRTHPPPPHTHTHRWSWVRSSSTASQAQEEKTRYGASQKHEPGPRCGIPGTVSGEFVCASAASARHVPAAVLTLGAGDPGWPDRCLLFPVCPPPPAGVCQLCTTGLARALRMHRPW